MHPLWSESSLLSAVQNLGWGMGLWPHSSVGRVVAGLFSGHVTAANESKLLQEVLWGRELSRGVQAGIPAQTFSCSTLFLFSLQGASS